VRGTQARIPPRLLPLCHLPTQAARAQGKLLFLLPSLQSTALKFVARDPCCAAPSCALLHGRYTLLCVLPGQLQRLQQQLQRLQQFGCYAHITNCYAHITNAGLLQRLQKLHISRIPTVSTPRLHMPAFPNPPFNPLTLTLTPW